MNLKLTLASALLMGLSISCSDDQPPAPGSDVSLAAPNSTIAAAAPPRSAPRATSIDAPPKDAQYTVYCMGVQGPDHTARANQIKLLWSQATGRKEWYVVHQDDQSNVYFGYYRSISNPKDRDAARAIADRTMLQNLKDSVGDQPFASAMLMPLDAPDPTAPPQWNLVNAKGAWSLEIAVYQGRDERTGVDRKRAAVEAVRQARAQGVEAYFYHGPSASSVCIGAWPAEAVVQHGAQQENTDPSKQLMIVPQALAKGLPNTFTDASGNQTQVIATGAEITDPTLIAAMQKYPIHAVNGAEDIVTSGGKPQVRSSMVVAVPHSDDSTASGAPTPQGIPTVNLLGNGNDDSAAGNRLRSMGQ